MRLRIQRWLLLATMLAPGFCATAAQVYVNYEQFEWTEEDTDGGTLLTEDGPLYGIGIAGVLAAGSRTEVAGRFEAFFGEVDYDGQTQAGEPLRTTTEYYGLAGEGDVRTPFSITEAFRLEPLMGLGARGWLRRLDNSDRDSIGYDEEWLAFYGRAGVHAAYEMDDRSHIFAEAAVRLPIYNVVRYDIDFDGGEQAVVHPGRESSFTAEAGAKIGDARLSIFYEQFVFSRSETEAVSSYFVVQPESRGSVLGLRIGLDF